MNSCRETILLLVSSSTYFIHSLCVLKCTLILSFFHRICMIEDYHHVSITTPTGERFIEILDTSGSDSYASLHDKVILLTRSIEKLYKYISYWFLFDSIYYRMIISLICSGGIGEMLSCLCIASLLGIALKWYLFITIKLPELKESNSSLWDLLVQWVSKQDWDTLAISIIRDRVIYIVFIYSFLQRIWTINDK